MWDHAAVAANVRTLRERGVTVLEPDAGELASGLSGRGRLPEVDAIVEALERLLSPRRDLLGERVLVTSGPTREPIDPVRYISNRSSGKMGQAVATAALRRGAEVILISGPTALTHLAVRTRDGICVFDQRAPGASRIEPGRTVTVDVVIDPEVSMTTSPRRY